MEDPPPLSVCSYSSDKREMDSSPIQPVTANNRGRSAARIRPNLSEAADILLESGMAYNSSPKTETAEALMQRLRAL
ncbi:hypothetical protein QYM36_004216 [Artemia franciscana]|uniref:Uncharacterized protein n=1 Tax=Artemia franciscana TaxID=6661 RepID=A0AA88I8I2_ARTSF|nr:hypothetical protein QYM36_004216 [Artemia franciscana]